MSVSGWTGSFVFVIECLVWVMHWYEKLSKLVEVLMGGGRGQGLGGGFSNLSPQLWIIGTGFLELYLSQLTRVWSIITNLLLKACFQFSLDPQVILLLFSMKNGSTLKRYCDL